ncbi:MAG TPA: hypothetical protein VK470_14740, partial [Bacteroidota bacterium]|nr:hypothetical protein [Bacteroidota bacterium]
DQKTTSETASARKQDQQTVNETAAAGIPDQPASSRTLQDGDSGASAQKPILPADVLEYYLRRKDRSQPVAYRAMVMGMSKLHFVDAKAGVDAWLPYTHMAPFSDDGRQADWEQSTQYGEMKNELDQDPAPNASFASVPASASNAKSYAGWKKTLATFLSQTVTVDLFTCAELKTTSKPGETEGEFRSRLSQMIREKRDLETEKLRAKYAPKIQMLQDRLQRAEEKVQREKAEYGQSQLSTALSVGATLLGAFMGRKAVSVGTITRATTAMRSAGRIGKEKGDVDRAGEGVESLRERMQEIDAQLEQDIAEITAKLDATSIALASTQIRPRKSDITIDAIALVWAP